MTRRVPAAATAAAVVIVLGWIGTSVGALAGFDDTASDVQHPGTGVSDEVVLVAIDRASLAAQGEVWPWPRTVHADLVGRLGAAGASVIVYDVLFAAPTSDDDTLAAAFAAGPPSVVASAAELRGRDELGLPVAVALTRPVPVVASAASARGHANVELDGSSGVVRLVPLAVSDERGVIVPSLAAAAVGLHRGGSPVVTVRPGGIQVGGDLVPVEGGATLRVNYSGGFTAGATVSAADVLAGTVDPAALAGRIVIVGVTDPTLGDQHLIPTDKSGAASGVVVHAEAVNTLLNRAYLQPASDVTTVAVIAVSVGVVVAVTLLGPAWWGLLAGVVWLGALIVWATWSFGRGTVVDLAWPVVCTVLALVAGITLRFVMETRHRLRATRLFAQYVPEADVDRLSDPARLQAASAGRRLHAAVMFADLRGFTAMSSGMEPSDLRRLLTIFYDWSTELVHAHGGTLMAFIGDEVYAVWGAPVEMAAPEGGAVACGLEMLDRAGELNARLAAETLPTVSFGIGVNSGEIVAAHLGGARRQYTAIGNTVNVASRLCSAAAAGQLVISDPVQSVVGHEEAVDLGEHEFKGVAAPMRIYRLGAEGER